MSYQVLARRYRPRSFDEVVGQEAAASTLRGAILHDRLAHAYLFSGPRGVGKTSMARIFAKALNCPRSGDRTLDPAQWGVPCDTCSTCEAIQTGQDIDVLELDGASHRGIEDIRSIIEAVNRPPTRSRYKVYIIDEVHMLTREAFNALLKTLEEPPPHVKFVFATTEAHRIPDTVLSRCQRFDFHPIDDAGIVRRLEQILEAEKRTAEEGLLERLARQGKGGLRDAQTLLDQLMTFSDGTLRVEDLDRMTGRVSAAAIDDLVAAALEREVERVLTCVRASFQAGADPAILLEQTVDALRRRMHAAVLAPAVAGGPAEPLDRILACLQILLDAAARLKQSPFAELSVEVVMLKIARLEDPLAIEEAIRLLTEIEKREAGSGAASRPTAASRPLAPSAAPAPAATLRTAPPPPAPAAAPVQAVPFQTVPVQAAAVQSAPPAPHGASPPAAAAAVAEPRDARLDFKKLLAVWGQVTIELESKFPDMAAFFKDASPAAIPDAPDVFLVALRSDFYLRQMKSTVRQEAFLRVVRDVSGDPWRARLEQGGKVVQLNTAAASLPAAGANDAAPAAAVAAEGPAAPGAGDASGIAKNPIVRKSVELFGGRIL